MDFGAATAGSADAAAVASGAQLRQLVGQMARRRSRFFSKRGLQQATRDQTLLRSAPTIEELAQAWQSAFVGDRVVAAASSNLQAAQLPVWVMVEQQLVLLLRQADSDGQFQICDAEGKEREVSAIGPVAWLPMSNPQSADAELSPVMASKAMWAALAEHRPWLLQVGLATVAINSLSVVSSLFAMQVYDRVVPNFAYATLWVLASGVVLSMLFELCFKSVRLKLQERVTRRMDEGLSRYFLERVMALRLDSRPKTVGTLVAQVRDYEHVKSFLTSTTLFAFADLPFSLLFLGIIYLIGGTVVLAPLVMIPLVCMVGFIAQYRLRHWQKLQAEESAIRSGLLFEAIDGAETIKAHAAEWRFSALWQYVNDRIAVAALRIREVSGTATHLSYLLQQTAYIGVVIAGVYQIEAGQLSMGGLIACSILGGRALGTLSGIAGLLVQYQQAAHSLQVLNRLLKNRADGGASQTAVGITDGAALRMQKIKYAYEPLSAPSLEVENLEIKQGERIAVLGRNGSGKSTLLRLLAGLATPTEGTVRYADIDLAQARPDWLRSVVGYLPQSPRLFAGTLRDNLTLGVTMPSDQEIAEAALTTGLDAVIARHPRGLDLRITEGGHGLSVGQRQLVALTRLVLQKPRLWLLDEPGASLDQEVEIKLIDYLHGLGPSVTLLFTTHQNVWLKMATRVLMVDAGKIAADVPADRAKITPVPTVPAAASAAQTGQPA